MKRAAMNGMLKKAIIFDMDGVLVNSEPIYQRMFHHFLIVNNCVIDEEIFSAIAGASTQNTWNIMAQLWYEDIDGESLHFEFRRQFPDFKVPYQEALFPGVENLLVWLKERGYVVGLASSSPERHINRMLDETDLREYFSFYISGDMFRQSKPDPEIYECAWSMTGCSKEECLVVEDSTYGIQAGCAAGMEVVAILDRDLGFDQSGASYFIDKVSDLSKLLENTAK